MRRAFSRAFSTTISRQAGSTSSTTARAIVFLQHGDPTQVLKCHTYTLPELKKGEVRVEFELTAINPADINVIQGEVLDFIPLFGYFSKFNTKSIDSLSLLNLL